MTIFEKLALEGARRAIRTHGLTERCSAAPTVKVAPDTNPGYEHFTVHFNPQSEIDEAETIVDVNVSTTGNPHGVPTCTTTVRTAGSFEYRYPHSFRTFLIHDREVATAL